MDLQEQAAHQLVEALRARHMGTGMSSGVDGYRVWVTEHPAAKVHFGYDHLRGLKVQYTFDGGRPEPVDYPLPTRSAADALADHLVAKIAGKGGGAATS